MTVAVTREGLLALAIPVTVIAMIVLALAGRERPKVRRFRIGFFFEREWPGEEDETPGRRDEQP